MTDRILTARLLEENEDSRSEHSLSIGPLDIEVSENVGSELLGVGLVEQDFLQCQNLRIETTGDL